MARSLALSCILSCCTIMLLQSASIYAQNSGKITVGQSLAATTNGGSSWLSPSGDFAFGFHQYGNSSDLFLLAIWYAKIPDTIVWFANQGYPVPQGSTVRLIAGQGLVLADSQGTHLWNASGAATISYGFMNDTGNFVLISSSSDVLWESFKNPTDTLMPTQIMERGQVLNSRQSDSNFTQGRFQFYFQDDGNLVMNTRELQSNFRYAPYYASMTWDGANKTTAGRQVVYDESGHMYLLRNDNSTIDLLSNPSLNKDYYQRATMDFDGMLTWYYHLRNSAVNGWSTIKMFPSDICTSVNEDHMDSGICGYNSICSLNNDGRPTCRCPDNYSLLDPSDTYGSCKPDFIQQQCDKYGQDGVKGKYKLVPLSNTNWPFGDYARLNPCTEEECKTSCLNDCFCIAAIYNYKDNGSCWKKRPPLAYGTQSPTTLGTTWLKVGDYSTYQLNPSLSTLSHKQKKNTVLSVLLGGSAFANFFLLSAISYGVFLIYQKKGFKRLDGDQRRTQREYSNVTCFSYQELEEGTNEFKEEIGKGAFGVVFKGTIGSGVSQMIVAVKKLHLISNSVDKEFETEVKVIGQTHHKNLVQLIGFCKQGDQRLLVYEYMSNGTLADYLFGDLKPSWPARIHVIHGIAKGILYLHEECAIQIIHCDIKPQNILIDSYYNARISDFGLAKLLDINQSQTNTAIRGTKGYVAPEWFRNKPVTVKVDVYSFGVLLLETICCRKCVDIYADETPILIDWASDCYHSRTLDSLVNDDMEVLSDRERLERFVMLALWCIQEDPSLRPTMRMVTQVLEGLVEVPKPPPPASFSIITQR